MGCFQDAIRKNSNYFLFCWQLDCDKILVGLNECLAAPVCGQVFHKGYSTKESVVIQNHEMLQNDGQALIWVPQWGCLMCELVVPCVLFAVRDLKKDLMLQKICWCDKPEFSRLYKANISKI